MRDHRPALRAVLFDALGTLVELDDPLGGLVRSLAARGIEAAPGEVGRALQVEIDFYRAEHHVAADVAALGQLRLECARVFASALGGPVTALDDGAVRDLLLEGLRFRAFDDVVPALAALRERGMRMAVVSNWDISLHEVLAAAGLTGWVDVVVTSAQERVQKPDPGLFAIALRRLGGAEPSEVLHVGDDLLADVQGARAAGIEPLLIDRERSGTPDGGVTVVTSLAGVVDRVDASTARARSG